MVRRPLSESIDRHLADAARNIAKWHSWAEVGDVVGTSRQAAHERFTRPAR